MQRRPARLLLALSAAAALTLGAAAAPGQRRIPAPGCQSRSRPGPVPMAVPTVAARPPAAPWAVTAARSARRRPARRARRPAPITSACCCIGARPRGTNPAAGIRPPLASAGENPQAMIAAVLANTLHRNRSEPRSREHRRRPRSRPLPDQPEAGRPKASSPCASTRSSRRQPNRTATNVVELDYFAHVSPSGETPVERIQATGYIPSPFDGYVLGENLAWGTYEPRDPAGRSWPPGSPRPRHLANILEAPATRKPGSA